MAKRPEFTTEQRQAFVLSYLQAYKSLQKRGLELNEETVGKFCHVQNLYASCYSRHEITRDQMKQAILETFEGKRINLSDEDII